MRESEPQPIRRDPDPFAPLDEERGELAYGFEDEPNDRGLLRVVGVIAVLGLVIAILILPPISLLDRGSGDTGAGITTSARDELPPLPAGLVARSELYDITVDDEIAGPATLTVRLGDRAADGEHLSFYSFRDGEWSRLSSVSVIDDGRAAQGEVAAVPGNIAVLARTAFARSLGLIVEVGEAPDPAAVSAASIISVRAAAPAPAATGRARRRRRPARCARGRAGGRRPGRRLPRRRRRGAGGSRGRRLHPLHPLAREYARRCARSRRRERRGRRPAHRLRRPRRLASRPVRRVRRPPRRARPRGRTRPGRERADPHRVGLRRLRLGRAQRRRGRRVAGRAPRPHRVLRADRGRVRRPARRRRRPRRGLASARPPLARAVGGRRALADPAGGARARELAARPQRARDRSPARRSPWRA